MQTVGIIVGGNYNEILVRQKSSYDIELGELLICEEGSKKYILEVCDIVYGSQISQQKMELFSGFNLETDEKSDVFQRELRLYKLAVCKPILMIKDGRPYSAKTIPSLFQSVRSINEQDLKGLFDKQLEIGYIRSGSKILHETLRMDPYEILSHHVLIPAQTGKGKSNLVKVLIWNALKFPKISFFILDPHNEYYFGSLNEKYGLKDHENSQNILFFASSQDSIKFRTSNVYMLKVYLDNIKPNHLIDILNLSEAQEQFAFRVYSKYKSDWILQVFKLNEKEIEELGAQDVTVNALRRKLAFLFDIDVDFTFKSVFKKKEKEEKDSIDMILTAIESGKSVILDTSNLRVEQELLISTIIAFEIFKRFRYYKNQGMLDEKPLVTFVLEEARRVLGEDSKSNVFSSIAREGRKFKLGLIAVTQLPSMIPREILANMNTKVILGIEMAKEREVVIQSSSQDIQELSKSIASLDKGEAIVTSAFLRFAVPIYIPLFEELVRNYHKQTNFKKKEEIFDML
ncbi:MAG: ATP-binding protein [Candidatus Woesearchaeota archaeon]